ncbi:MAG: transmembrane anchor protein [Maricaulis sp.]|nr:transmembrane anchor protein [Oceanicaulis sp.]MAZ91059.1 transmembrane anchor protein [Maricaulis sp.]
MFNSQLPSRDDLPSSESLLKSTLVALLAAIVILVTIVLPAEYGIDPTRIGRVLGLTQMGAIKMQLAEEAAADREASTAQTDAPASQEATVSSAAAIPQDTPVETAVPEEAAPADEAPAEPAAPEWRDTISITLQPGEATEVKLTMRQGEVAIYEWTTDQAGLNSDLHGDNPQDAFISYRQGRNEPGDSGEFTAEFDGAHGWFWRNRSEVAVTVTLRTRGAYSEFNRLF